MHAVGTTAKIGFGRRSASAGLRGGDSKSVSVQSSASGGFGVSLIIVEPL